MSDIKIGLLPFKEQRKFRPEIETIIHEQLKGENKSNALEFVAWLRENDMIPKYSSKNNWRCVYKHKHPLGWLKLDHNGEDK